MLMFEHDTGDPFMLTLNGDYFERVKTYNPVAVLPEMTWIFDNSLAPVTQAPAITMYSTGPGHGKYQNLSS